MDSGWCVGGGRLQFCTGAGDYHEHRPINSGHYVILADHDSVAHDVCHFFTTA